MSNANFQKLLDKLSNAHSKYLNLLDSAEDEYKKRYGDTPSNRNDDFWIDTYQVSYGSAKVEEIEKAALFYRELEE